MCVCVCLYVFVCYIKLLKLSLRLHAECDSVLLMLLQHHHCDMYGMQLSRRTIKWNMIWYVDNFSSITLYVHRNYVIKKCSASIRSIRRREGDDGTFIFQTGLIILL